MSHTDRDTRTSFRDGLADFKCGNLHSRGEEESAKDPAWVPSTCHLTQGHDRGPGAGPLPE